jgi:broad specificity phosphatase PhoE
LRAKQTAEIINQRYGLEIVFDPDLREADVSYLSTLPQRSDPLTGVVVDTFAPEYERMRGRVARAIARILEENSEGQVLVIGHGGSLGTLMRSILGRHALLVRTEQTGVHCLRWHDGRWDVQYLNRQEHLVGLTEARVD